MAGQTRIDGNLIDTGTDPNDIVSVSVGDGRYPRLSQDNTLAGNMTVSGQVRSDTVTDSAGTGAPAFPNGMSVTGAALTDPEITGGIYLGGTGSANYLDDYEEGTWTPVVEIGGSSSGITGNTFAGEYIKVGKAVTINCQITLTSKGSNTGTVNITGLPFSKGNYRYHAEIGYFNFAIQPRAIKFNSQSFVQMVRGDELELINEDHITDNSEIYFALTYRTV